MAAKYGQSYTGRRVPGVLIERFEGIPPPPGFWDPSGQSRFITIFEGAGKLSPASSCCSKQSLRAVACPVGGVAADRMLAQTAVIVTVLARTRMGQSVVSHTVAAGAVARVLQPQQRLISSAVQHMWCAAADGAGGGAAAYGKLWYVQKLQSSCTVCQNWRVEQCNRAA